MGEHDEEVVDRCLPEPIHRLHCPLPRWQCDVSGIGAGDDRIADESAPDPEPEPAIADCGVAGSHNSIRAVRDLSLDYFRSKLVTHFDIAFKRTEVKWPKRTRRCQPATRV